MTNKLKLTPTEQSWILDNVLIELSEQIETLERDGNTVGMKFTEKKAKAFWNKLIDLDVIQHYSNAKSHLPKYDLENGGSRE